MIVFMFFSFFAFDVFMVVLNMTRFNTPIITRAQEKVKSVYTFCEMCKNFCSYFGENATPLALMENEIFVGEARMQR